jgi:ribonucleotide monophosphatase NagD (HAD superfamily)
MALRRINHPKYAIMVRDNLQSDIESAQKLGLAGA